MRSERRKVRVQPRVLIAGGGIGGLSLALTLDQIGVDCLVLESVREPRPLGVGINLQPNAVRELADLGIDPAMMDTIGIPAKEWALVGLNGREIYSEPRGRIAGYHWDQYAVHRGRFHMLLHELAVARLGVEKVRLGQRVTGYRKEPDGSVTALCRLADGTEAEERGTLLFGADGIHSSVRAQMHPDQAPIHWGGTVMWRGTTRAKAIRTGSSFVGLGTARHRVVIYPISQPDAEGLCDVNWIAEQTFDEDHDWQSLGWFRPVDVESFAHHFTDFVYDWIDLPALIAGADVAYENPMIDRDPIPTWVDGPVALMGDAAHPMYPTGSNGASQAIMDARRIGALFLEMGVGTEALAAFDARYCAPVGQLALRNRGAGPFGLLDMVEERCGGIFEDIEDVIPKTEREEFMRAYQRAAGFAMQELNASPATIAPGARIEGDQKIEEKLP